MILNGKEIKRISFGCSYGIKTVNVVKVSFETINILILILTAIYVIINRIN